MFIGTASGSTGGGIKVTTFGVLLVAIISTVRGRPSAEAFGRRIPHSVVYQALSVALLSIAVRGHRCLRPAARERPWPRRRRVRDRVRARHRRASTGMTPDLGVDARLLLIVTMFIGRLGPLTLVLALSSRARRVPYRPAVETVRIG